MLMLLLQALFVKTIAHPPTNARANLGLKITDIVIKLFAMPHIDKEAYFDDMWAQVANLVQIAGITAYVDGKYGQLVDMGSAGARRSMHGKIGLDGDALGQLFMATTIAGILPNMISAFKESYRSLSKVIDQTRAVIDEHKDTALAMYSAANEHRAQSYVEKARIIFGTKRGGAGGGGEAAASFAHTGHMAHTAPVVQYPASYRTNLASTSQPRVALPFQTPLPQSRPTFRSGHVTEPVVRADDYARAGYEMEAFGSAGRLPGSDIRLPFRV